MRWQPSRTTCNMRLLTRRASWVHFAGRHNRERGSDRAPYFMALGAVCPAYRPASIFHH